jgi:hypothetical protein
MSKAYVVLNGKRYNLQEQEDKTSKREPAKGETGTQQDVPKLLTSIYGSLKGLVQLFEENLPNITKAADKKGQH